MTLSVDRVCRMVVGAHDAAAIANHASRRSDNVDAAPIAFVERTSASKSASPR